MAVCERNGAPAASVFLYGLDDRTDVVLPNGDVITVHSTGSVILYPSADSRNPRVIR